MILALSLVLGIVTYLVIGVFYSRSRQITIRTQVARGGVLWPMDQFDLTIRLLWRGVLWPIGILVDFVLPAFQSWFYRPWEQHRQREQRRREDLTHWRSVIRDPLASPEAKDNARQLIDILENTP